MRRHFFGNPLWAPWLAFGVPLALYGMSLFPDVMYWDSGEMQTVPYILGIAHSTGFPLFVLSGWVFSHLFVLGNVAWRLSFMSAIAMALAAYAVYALTLRLGGTSGPSVERPVAVVAAWLFAVGSIAWTRGTRAEVHAFAVALTLLSILNAIDFRMTGKRRYLYFASLWLGLGLANHPIAALSIPGLLLIACRRYRSVMSTVGLRSCAIVLACLSMYLYLPVRSAYLWGHRVDPTLALGVAPGKPYWDNNHPATWSGFKREVLGEDFGAGGTVARLMMPQTYLQAVPEYVRKAGEEYGCIVLGAGLLGLLFILRDDPWLGIGLLLAGMLGVCFGVSYRPVEADVDRYFLVAYALLNACAAVAITRGFRMIFSRLPALRKSRLAATLSLLTLSILAARAFSNHWSIFDQHADYSARRWVERVRTLTPPHAIIIASWTYATPLAYASYVEGSLGNRVLENAWIGDDRQLLTGWLRKMPVYVASDNPRLEGYRFEPVDAQWPPLYRILPSAKLR